MKKIFIIQGFGGIPNGGWISWIMQQFSKEKIYVCALPMPNPKNPVLSEWLEEISRAINNSQDDDELYIVGHSLGATTLLRYLEINPKNKKIAGVVFVSGVIHPLDIENKESNFRKIDSFLIPDIDLIKVKNKVNKVVSIHSKDDPIVPFIQGEELSKALSCEFIATEKGGHFYILAEPVLYEFPELLKILKELLVS
ncbi:MAG: alpha/beta fold hydrolase [Candidatus Nomurabacteria bacterium]